MSSNSVLESLSFDCEKCCEKFTRKYNLIRHMVRKHSSSDENVKQQNSHNPQQNSHNEEMANKCLHCDKQFVANWRIPIHVEK